MKHVIDLAASKPNRRIPILGTVLVQGKRAYATDMDYIISAPAKYNGVQLKPGIYNPWLLVAGVNRQCDTYQADDFPTLHPEGEEIARTTLDADAINGLAWVAKAMSTEATRFYLTGVAFRKADFVATDGHRLHMVKHTISEHEGFESGLIVPGEVIKKVLKVIASEKAESVQIRFTKRNAIFAIGEYILRTKLIDGTFPAIERVMPKYTRNSECGKKEEYYGHKTAFDPSEHKKSLPTIKALARAHGNSLKNLHVRFEEGAIRYPYEQGWSRETVTKPAEPIGFNIHYLQEMIAGEMECGNSHDPATIRNGNRIGIVMPARA